jgi:hypothetical protein
MGFAQESRSGSHVTLDFVNGRSYLSGGFLAGCKHYDGVGERCSQRDNSAGFLAPARDAPEQLAEKASDFLKHCFLFSALRRGWWGYLPRAALISTVS